MISYFIYYCVITGEVSSVTCRMQFFFVLLFLEAHATTKCCFAVCTNKEENQSNCVFV